LAVVSTYEPLAIGERESDLDCSNVETRIAERRLKRGLELLGVFRTGAFGHRSRENELSFGPAVEQFHVDISMKPAQRTRSSFARIISPVLRENYQ
jgi:hypothetical protein